MTVIEPKKSTSQEVDGSPAQIWTELGLLAQEIFGSNNSDYFTVKCEEINTAVSSADLPELPGFKSPTAECEQRHTHAHTHTHIV